MKNFILDAFQISGNDLKSFKTHTEMLDENTILVPFNTEDIDIITCITQSNETKINVVSISSGVWLNISDIAEGIKRGMLPLSLFNHNTELINEVKNKNKTMFRIESDSKKELYLCSFLMNKTFGAKQSGVGGDLLKQSGLKRDIALSQLLEQNAFKGNLLVRKDGKCKKIFGFYSEKHARMPFTDMYNACKWIKDAKNVNWTSDNKKTEIYIEFEEKNGFIPGILLYSSDTSYAPTGVAATVRKSNNKNFFVLKEWRNEHYFSVFSVDELTDFTKKAKIYAEEMLEGLLKKIAEKENIFLSSVDEYTLKLQEIASKTLSKRILLSTKNNEIKEFLSYKEECSEKDLVLKMFDVIDFDMPNYQLENIKKLISEIMVVL